MKMKTPLPKLMIAAICIAASFHQGNMLAQARARPTVVPNTLKVLVFAPAESGKD
jgi:hypothetical protein